mmetsp:Transcript_13633/g.30902  ORF Transcript_13633/g.30902 Transcript_13633/m.30902 type:complete len:127 (-) Transcript_13633:300-680(-)
MDPAQFPVSTASGGQSITGQSVVGPGVVVTVAVVAVAVVAVAVSLVVVVEIVVSTVVLSASPIKAGVVVVALASPSENDVVVADVDNVEVVLVGVEPVEVEAWRAVVELVRVGAVEAMDVVAVEAV